MYENDDQAQFWGFLSNRTFNYFVKVKKKKSKNITPAEQLQNLIGRRQNDYPLTYIYTHSPHFIQALQ